MKYLSAKVLVEFYENNEQDHCRLRDKGAWYEHKEVQ